MDITIVHPYFYPYKASIETQIFEILDRMGNKYDFRVITTTSDVKAAKNRFPNVEVCTIPAVKFNIPYISPPPLMLYLPPFYKFKQSKAFHFFIESFGLLSYMVYSRKSPNKLAFTAQCCAAKPFKLLTNSLANSTATGVMTFYNTFVSKPFFKKVTKMTAASNFTRKDYYTTFNIPKEKTQTIPNAINAKKFRFKKEFYDEIRGKYNIDDFFVFSCGRIVPYKGFQHLVKAVQDLEGISLGIAGCGAFVDQLKKLDKKKKVKFFGQVPNDEIVKFYSACDLFVTPSTCEEPFGIVNIEAMSCGKPVIATKVGGIPEIVKDGETGFLVKPGSPEQIGHKIIKLKENEELRKRMGMAGRKRAEMYFDWKVIILKWEELYNSLLA